jgi:predicted DCC family thiol-disulfide oxidoreductase YuxK
MKPISSNDLMQKQIIFFDGVCGLCNASVNWLMKKDKKGVFLFAPLQGITAQSALPKAYSEQMNTLVYLKYGSVHNQSDAVLFALKDLGGVWKIIGFCLSVFPQSLRNFVYHWVSKNRYTWFGKLDQCRLPTAEEKAKFLP